MNLLEICARGVSRTGCVSTRVNRERTVTHIHSLEHSFVTHLLDHQRGLDTTFSAIRSPCELKRKLFRRGFVAGTEQIGPVQPKCPGSHMRKLAEREGFEPSVRLPVLLISSQARSASSGTSPRWSASVLRLVVESSKAGSRYSSAAPRSRRIINGSWRSLLQWAGNVRRRLVTLVQVSGFDGRADTPC